MTCKSVAFCFVIDTTEPRAGWDVRPLIESIAKSTISTPALIADNILAAEVPDVSCVWKWIGKFVISFISLIEADYNTFIQWIQPGGNSVFLILLAITIYHHGQLELQVIIEDYIKNESAHFITLIAVKLGSFFLAVYTIFSIARLTFGT